jgi:uncharacterized membrane protein
MTDKEVTEIILSYSLLIALFTSLSWYGLYSLIHNWKKKKAFFIINSVIIIFYTIYFINGRIYHSEYGGALVWPFYLALLFLAHNVLLLIVAMVIRKKLKRQRMSPDFKQPEL